MNVSMEKNYRIDILKLRQKIYDAYSANSEARKLMLKKEQLDELNSLTVATKVMYPEDQIKYIMDDVEEKIGACAIFSLLGLTLITALFAIEFIFPIQSIFGLTCFYIIIGLIGFGTGFSVKQLVNGWQAIRNTKRARKTMNDRIKKLKKKIFGDI